MPPPFQIVPAKSADVQPSAMHGNVIIPKLDQRGPLFYAELDTGKVVAGVIIGYAIVPAEKWNEAYLALLEKKKRERLTAQQAAERQTRPWWRIF